MARSKKLMTFYLAPELLKRLDVWLAKQEFPPTKTAVVEAALREFLDARERKRNA
jgi:predicted transcriptional regulator